jgi:predicted transcriptional regulator
MKKIIKLNENDLYGIVKRVMNENLSNRTGELYAAINALIDREFDDVDPSDVVDILENILRNSKAIHHRRKNNIGSLTKDEVLRNFRK